MTRAPSPPFLFQEETTPRRQWEDWVDHLCATAAGDELLRLPPPRHDMDRDKTLERMVEDIMLWLRRRRTE